MRQCTLDSISGLPAQATKDEELRSSGQCPSGELEGMADSTCLRGNVNSISVAWLIDGDHLQSFGQGSVEDTVGVFVIPEVHQTKPPRNAQTRTNPDMSNATLCNT